jgi:acyl carrier protein
MLPEYEEVLAAVCGNVRDILVQTPEELPLAAETRLVGDLGFDSLDTIELMNGLDDRFLVRLRVEDYQDEDLTLGALAHRVLHRIRERQPCSK